MLSNLGYFLFQTAGKIYIQRLILNFQKNQKLIQNLNEIFLFYHAYLENKK